MAAPFTQIPLKEQTFFQKLFKKQPKENAIIELNNLFAKSSNLKQVNIEDIENLSTKYKINIRKNFKKKLQDIYKQFFEFCLSDKILSENEIEQLSHLKFLFNLEERIINQIHREISIKVYKKSVDEVLADGKLEDEEKSFLENLKQTLQLPDEIANKIYAKKAQEYLQNYLNEAISDQRLSPDEEKELNILAKNLNVDFKYDESTKKLLQKYRLFWLIENGNIPVIDAGINLQKNEECYFITNCNWYEYRKVTKRINYGGPTFRIKIAKGVYWRTGSLGVQRVSENVLSLIDSGRLFLTNKRIIFIGDKKAKNIRLNKILDFTPYKNGVEIIKDSGKSPFLEFDKGIDIFSMILGKVLTDY